MAHDRGAHGAKCGALAAGGVLEEGERLVIGAVLACHGDADRPVDEGSGGHEGLQFVVERRDVGQPLGQGDGSRGLGGYGPQDGEVGAGERVRCGGVEVDGAGCPGPGRDRQGEGEAGPVGRGVCGISAPAPVGTRVLVEDLLTGAQGLQTGAVVLALLFLVQPPGAPAGAGHRQRVTLPFQGDPAPVASR